MVKKHLQYMYTEREKCLSELYKNDYYETTDNDNESVINLSERYIDIKNYFPEEMEKELLPIFYRMAKRENHFCRNNNTDRNKKAS